MKMVASFAAFCLLFLVNSYAFAQDPCSPDVYRLLPRADYRGGNCTYNSSKPTCDATLLTGWYRAVGRVGNLKLQDTEADLYTCGTKFAVWMDGPHPSSLDGEVNRTVREMVSSSTWNITVKNCQDEYYVYKLTHTPSCPVAYCFGATSSDPCPPFDPCDFYEHEYVPYKPERSGYCVDYSPNQSDPGPNTFNSSWVVFRDSDEGFLNVSSSPLEFGDCGSTSPMWVKETISTDSENIKTQKLCIAEEYESCAMGSTIRSKECPWFVVYEVPRDISRGRLCLDDPGASCTEKDPCDSSVYRELPRADYRGGGCAFNADKSTCDVALIPGWYRASSINGNLRMQETEAEFGTCGTKFPIWMNKSHPSSTDGEVSVILLQAFSYKATTAKVKNCNDEYFVYRLQPTGACPEAFCFGLTDTDPCPPFDPCDIYEHSVVDYEGGRSAACNNLHGEMCVKDSFDLPWVAFRNKNGGYLNVSRLPSRTGSCGSRSPMWIKETKRTDQNGISIETACIGTEESECGKEVEMKSKICDRFTVYEPPTTIQNECSRLCLDDLEANCPEEETDSADDLSRDRHYSSGKENLWIIAAVLVPVILIAGLGLACLINRHRKYMPPTRAQRYKINTGTSNQPEKVQVSLPPSQQQIPIKA